MQKLSSKLRRAFDKTYRKVMAPQGNVWDEKLLAGMQRDWDERARENARHYVATLQEEWTDDEFFRSGEIWVENYILGDLSAFYPQRSPAQMRVLEIGCGAGRMTRPLAKLFGEVDAVDVSGEMIERARQALHDCSNVRLYQNNGVDLSMFGAEEFDYAFSGIVFQHIPSKSFVENYIREAQRVLRSGSVFKFQAQGAPTGEQTYDTWQGVGFSETEMRQIAERCGFEVRCADGANTQYFWLTFFKA